MGALVGAAYVAGHLAGLRHGRSGDLAQDRPLDRLRLDRRRAYKRPAGGGLPARPGHRRGESRPTPAIRRRRHRHGDRPRDLAAVRADPRSGARSIALPGIVSPRSASTASGCSTAASATDSVSVCRALGADGDHRRQPQRRASRRRYTEPEPPDATVASRVSVEVVAAHVRRLPAALQRPVAGAVGEGPPAAARDEPAPGYFDVLASALNIMQDHITRSRMAGEPPPCHAWSRACAASA